MKIRRNSICLFLLCLLITSCQEEKQHITEELKLISWNCDNFQLSADTLQAAAGCINTFQPHILCLQERPHTNLLAYRKIKQAFPQLKYKVTNGREDENLNIAIFSRYPLTHVKTWYFKGTYNKMIQADVNWNGKMFRLFNVHLQTTAHGKNLVSNIRNRSNQSNLLKSEIKKSPYPVLICGDFNDIPCSYTLLNLLTNLKDLSLSLTGSYQKLAGIFKIDYILGSPEWKQIDYQLLPNSWSDHKIQQAVIGY